MTIFARHARRYSLGILAAGCVGIVIQSAGCASSGGVASAPVAAAPSADARFLEAAERSSAWAVRMSDLVIEKGSRFEIKKAAKAIRARESVNLAMLAKERARLGLSEAMSDHHSDPRMAVDEERMAAARGPDADDFYVQRMLEQRREIISLAIFAKPDLASRSLAAFAGSLPAERERDLSDLRGVQFATRTVPETSRAQLGIPAMQATGTQTGVQTSQPTNRTKSNSSVPR